LCEKDYRINPYVFCNNNPIRYRDSNGKEITFIPVISPISNKKN